MVNSKQKGASFERDICRRFSLWLSNGKQEDALWRSSMSGGRSTVAHAKGKRMAAQAGDISAVDTIGIPLISKYLLECKAYKTLDFHGLLTGRGKLVEFWQEACTQARRYNKEPMLIAKQNSQPIILCTTKAGLEPFDVPIILHAPALRMRVVLLDIFLAKAVNPWIGSQP